ncbi:MAG: GNAT family N-acetyltransferase [Acidobacteria bacterium]|nr:GNAT family N-acetyltransferase [Acidobacteriota bacterium]MBI3488427.1 GNAT family N-acetyltransferase [Acidobacteriota bacterium]
MRREVEFSRDRASETELLDHLRACGSSFDPPLGDRVDLPIYARKLAIRATRFEAWANGLLAGLVAVYCNDLGSEVAYITSVSVLETWTGKGIARHLLDQCAGFARAGGFKVLRLEVGVHNLAARRLYESFGFIVEAEDSEFARMGLAL